MRRLLMLIPCLLFAQPQPPPIPASAELRQLIQMRQVRDDYAVPGTVITVLVTQTVTTVYELDYLRFTRAKANPTNINLVTMKTNWLVLGTNPVSCVTNSSPVNPWAQPNPKLLPSCHQIPCRGL